MSIRNMMIGGAGATKPGAPTIGTATAGNASASVTFSAPAENGGSAITGFTVTASPGGATGTGSSSPITVSGLSNGTAYTFTVTATNAVGTSNASSASNSVTPFTPQLTGTYYNSYSTLPSSSGDTAGTAKIVFNGYGLLFYGWQTSAVTTGMHQITLPSFLINKVIDITVAGQGGEHYGGGSGGGGGGGGGRHIGTLTSQTAYIKTGNIWADTNPISTGSHTAGQYAVKNTQFYVQLSGSYVTLNVAHAGDNDGGEPSGFNVYNYRGPTSYGTPTLLSSTAGNLSQVTAVDSTFQYTYAGHGGALQGFGPGNTTFNGSDLGGGGGGQNCSNYGGSCAGGTGGRYGYSGGNEGQIGGGPSGGRQIQNATYPKGGGGSFGGGTGDAGNNNSYATGGGGAVLIRWDTLAGFGVGFQTGTSGFP